MASLVLTIGTLNGTVSANNTKASNILNKYADAIGATGTNQERADAVVLSLAQHMIQEGKRHYGNTTMSNAATAIQAELDALTWE